MYELRQNNACQHLGVGERQRTGEGHRAGRARQHRARKEQGLMLFCICDNGFQHAVVIGKRGDWADQAKAYILPILVDIIEVAHQLD